MTPERIRYKGRVLRAAWLRRFGAPASLNEAVMGVSVAIGETRAGDSWPGEDGIVGTPDDERDWGATTLRALNAYERSVIAAKGRELLRATELPQRTMHTEYDRLDFEASPQRFVWLFHDADGKVTERVFPDARELAALAPLTPIVGTGHEARARAVQRLLIEQLPDCPAAHPPDGRRGSIHCDSSPTGGPYFVWFATFDDPEKTYEENDIEGAMYFLGALTRTAYERQALKSGDPDHVARAMYSAVYFTGFHVKDRLYPQPDGSQVLGSELNIRDYARTIMRIAPSVRPVLAQHDTDPAMPAVHEEPTPRETPEAKRDGS